MKAINFLMQLHLPMSTERPCTEASRSEVKRWVRRGAVLFNGEAVAVDEPIDFRIISLVYFPNGKRKTTMF